MLKGQKMSEESKMKMSNSKKELYNSGFKPFWLNKKRPDISGRARDRMLGKKLNIITKHKLSIAKTGSKHWNWKGGVSRAYKTGYYSKEYKEWRQRVFIRDGFTCQGCGDEGYITAHHIKSFAHYPELRFDLDNGLTLCESCHKETDNYKGRNKIIKLVSCQ